MYKYSVLTCLFVKKGNLMEINDKREDVEYICVTDDKTMKSDTWTIILVDDFILSLPFINQYTYIRYHPFEFVSNDICVYLDASIRVLKDFREEIVEPFVKGGYEYGISLHPCRKSISEETHKWTTDKGYPIEQATKVVQWLANTEEKTNRLFQSGLLIHKNCRTTNFINNRTWELCHQWGKGAEIDINNQCDLTFVLNHFFDNSDKIMVLPSQVIYSNYLQITHRLTGFKMNIEDNK